MKRPIEVTWRCLDCDHRAEGDEDVFALMLNGHTCKPAVALPTEPALGWIENRSGELDLDFWRYRDTTDRAGEGAWAGIDPDGSPRGYGLKNIADFTPATAVPTSALDELRKAENVVRGVIDFLAAVDEAGQA